ncbi:MAG: NAD(P)H-dependent oxidoreductase [Sulfitobacter sp.]
MSKRIFILNGHPADHSLNQSLAEAYAKAAKDAGHDVRLTHLSTLSFDMDYGFAGYAQSKPLEPCLETLLSDIEWCEHFVLTTPMWWGSLPAKLKGAIDRAFLPGRTFDTRVAKGKMPRPLLVGRTARVILTSDSPKWFLSLLYRNAMLHQLQGQILGFVGIKPTRFTYLAGASHPKPGQIEKWHDKVTTLGTKAA